MNCKQCKGEVDHKPGGPFCQVVSKIASLQIQNDELQEALRDKDRLIDDMSQTLTDLRMAFIILKETHRILDRAGNA